MNQNSRVAVFRSEHFNAAHRLHNPALSDEENQRIFGKCNLPHYHGHNYELVVKLVGEPDAITGYVYDLKQLGDLVKEEVVERFDHKNLNLDVPEFANMNPTAENIAVVIYRILRPKINESLDLAIRLYETPRNYVEYPA
jgi:6-pyruvoyltetrahydropterin/6-carboxytetrahydropterin synthase